MVLMGSGGFWLVLVSYGAVLVCYGEVLVVLWWVLVGSGGFWWVLEGSGGFWYVMVQNQNPQEPHQNAP